MKTVRDDDGTPYLLLKRSDDASLVRDPKTGNECYIGNDRLESLDDKTALEVTALAVPHPLRTLVTAVHDDRTLGLLLWLDEDGPLAVRTILAESTYCESDLNGLLSSLTVSGLLETEPVDGEAGYRTTEACSEGLETLLEQRE